MAQSRGVEGIAEVKFSLKAKNNSADGPLWPSDTRRTIWMPESLLN